MGTQGPTKRDLREMQMLGGGTNVFGTEIVQAWTSLWHGRRLAGTSAALGALGWLALFLASLETGIGAPAPLAATPPGGQPGARGAPPGT